MSYINVGGKTYRVINSSGRSRGSSSSTPSPTPSSKDISKMNPAQLANHIMATGGTQSPTYKALDSGQATYRGSRGSGVSTKTSTPKQTESQTPKQTESQTPKQTEPQTPEQARKQAIQEVSKAKTAQEAQILMQQVTRPSDALSQKLQQDVKKEKDKFEKAKREFAESVHSKLKKGGSVEFISEGGYLKGEYTPPKQPFDARSKDIIFQTALSKPDYGWDRIKSNVFTQPRIQAEASRDTINPLSRFATIAVAGAGENIIRTGKNIKDYVVTRTKQPSLLIQDNLNMQAVVLGSGLWLQKKQDEYISSPIETGKKDIAKGTTAGLIFLGKVKADPVKSAGRTASFVLELYTYNKIIKVIGATGKFAKGAFSPTTAKKMLASKTASFRGGGMPTPKKTLKQVKPKTKAQIRKESLKQAYDPRAYRDMQKGMLGVRQAPTSVQKAKGIKEIIKGVDFKTNELFKVQKGKRIAVEQRRLYGTRQRTIQVKPRQPSISGKAFSRPSSQVTTPKPKSIPGIVVSVDKGASKSVMAFAPSKQQTLSKGIIEKLFPKRTAIYKQGFVDRSQRLLSEEIRRSIRLTKKQPQLTKRVPTPQTPTIKGMRSGRSTQQLLQRLQQQKQARIAELSKQQTKAPIRVTTTSQPSQTYSLAVYEPKTSSLTDKPFSSLSPKKRRLKRLKSFIDVSYTPSRPITPTQAESARQIAFSGTKEVGQIIKPVTVYKIGQTYMTAPDAMKVGISSVSGSLKDSAKIIGSQFDIKGVSVLGISKAIQPDRKTESMQGMEVNMKIDSMSDSVLDVSSMQKQNIMQRVDTSMDMPTSQVKTPQTFRRTPSKTSQRTTQFNPQPIKPIPPSFPNIPRIRTTPRQIPKPEIIPPIIPRLSLRQDRFKRLDSFEVQVRRGGVFGRSARTFLSLDKAFRTGKKVVGTTAAASFRIVDRKSGKVVESIGKRLPKQFRQSKRERGVFIERRKYRISSPGERREITQKGLFTIKVKKNIFGGK
jgi:hypothetical protein